MHRKKEEKDRKQKTRKVEQGKRKRLKRIGSKKTKMEKYIFHLENRSHDISVPGRYLQETQVKDRKDRKKTGKQRINLAFACVHGHYLVY